MSRMILLGYTYTVLGQRYTIGINVTVLKCSETQVRAKSVISQGTVAAVEEEVYVPETWEKTQRGF